MVFACLIILTVILVVGCRSNQSAGSDAQVVPLDRGHEAKVVFFQEDGNPMSSADPARLARIRRLGRHRDTPAVRLLCDTLRMVDQADVQWEAAKALVTIGRPACAQLARIVADHEWYCVDSAGESAGFDTEQWPLWCATWALNQVADSRWVRALAQPLRSPYYPARVEAAFALVRRGRLALPVVRRLLDDKDEFVRAQAMWILGQSRNPAAMELLLPRATYRPSRHQDGNRSSHDVAAARAALVRFGPSAVRRLMEELARGYEWEGVADALVAFGPASLPQLRRALASPDSLLRGRAARCLGLVRDSTAVPFLAPVTADRCETTAREAMTALSQIGGTSAMSALARAARDPRPRVRRYALAMIISKHSPEGRDPFMEALRDSSARVREIAARGLGVLGDTTARPELWRLLDDDREAVRTAALVSLGELGDGRVVDQLLARLRSLSATSEWDSRTWKALWRIKTKQATDSLLARMGTSFRYDIAEELASRHDPRADSAVIAAVMALRLGTERTTQTLVNLGLVKPDISDLVAHHQDTALMRMGVDAVEPLAAIMCTAEVWKRAFVAGVLVRIGDRRGHNELCRMLADSSLTIIQAAVGIVADLGDTSFIEPLLAARYNIMLGAGYGHPESLPAGWTHRRSAALNAREDIYRACRRFRDPRCVNALISDLQDTTGPLSDAVPRALAAFGDSTAFDALAASLKTKAGRGRTAVLDALAKVSPRRAFPLLLSVLADSTNEPSFRSEAAGALAKTKSIRASFAVASYVRRTSAIRQLPETWALLSDRGEPWSEAQLMRAAFEHAPHDTLADQFDRSHNPHIRHAGKLMRAARTQRYLLFLAGPSQPRL